MENSLLGHQYYREATPTQKVIGALSLGAGIIMMAVGIALTITGICPPGGVLLGVLGFGLFLTGIAFLKSKNRCTPEELEALLAHNHRPNDGGIE